MKSFQVPSKDQVSETSQAIFGDLEKKLGMVPNLYATIGYSGNALGSYLAFSGAQAKGSFTAKQREAAFLAVSQVNGCQYCLSVHTHVGKLNGFTEEETFQLRSGTHSDPKLGAITRLAASITKNHGRPDAQLLEDFFAQGYEQAALIDLIALVADKTLANYVHNVTQVPIDFPLAKPLEAAVV